jgi:hypothetical protein
MSDIVPGLVQRFLVDHGYPTLLLEKRIGLSTREKNMSGIVVLS